MDRTRFADLLRQAATLPPHRLVTKAARFAQRQVRDASRRRKDFAHGTYSSLQHGLTWRGRVSVEAQEIAAGLHEPLRLLGENHRRHRFDLLGSGWVEVRYGTACRGFAGRSFPPHPAVDTDADGAWLAGHVNASNLAASQALWRRVGVPAYQPIDWQLDFRSGYRWRADAHFSALPIPVDTGADVKVPWELGRLQHLPQLALCAVLAASGTTGFAPAADYLGELRCQLLDFLALNPPRFGVNWMCPMDVGIRIVNVLLAIDLAVGAERDQDRRVVDQDLIDVVLGSARDHAEHISSHLEWSERERSNHYLANLVAVVWAASYLTPGRRTDAMLGFAAAELLREAELQFGPDGGNYEGSTNYHRLSGELVLFGLALLVGLSDEELARIDEARPDALEVRAPWQAGPLPRHALPGGATTIVPPALQEKLFRAGVLTEAATHPDGRVVQIGDTDSGRLFKLTPVRRYQEREGEHTYSEDALDHRALVAGVGALFGAADEAGTIDSVVVRQLRGGREFSLPAPHVPQDHGELAAIIQSIEALPVDCRRRRQVPFAAPIPLDLWRRAAFPQFGLYVFASATSFIAFRCAPIPPAGAPLGHTHDDNLAIEYVLGGESRIDPGAFCYTPSCAMRDRYRGADAHDVVRAVGWDVAPAGPALFWLDHVAWARCLAWRPDGVAGEIAAPRGRLVRALRLSEWGLEIWDGVDPPNRLRPIAPQIEVASDYGRLEPSRHAAP